MSISSNLLAFRIYKNLELSEVAKELSLSVAEYILLEEGKMTLTNEVAEKLSSIYQVPTEIFEPENIVKQNSFTYSNNIFNNSNGYVNHLKQTNEKVVNAIISIKNEQIGLLKEEVQRLRAQNDKLITRLIK